MDTGISETFLEFLKHQRLLIDYVHISAYGLLVYDYLLTLGPEIELIWFSPWNYTKVLYLLTRYLPMIDALLGLHDQVLLNVTADSCAWTFPLAIWLLTFGIYCAEVILAIRTWAVWHQNRRVGFGLAALLAGSLILECIYIIKFLENLKITRAPYSGFRGCFVTGSSHVIFVNFITIGVVEIIVLALMIISAFRAYKSGNNNELLNVIHRDGIIFYIYLLCLAVSNLVTVLVLPVDLETLLVPLQSVFYSVFATRIIINIRTAGRQRTGSMTELHEGYHETREISMPLAFRSRGQLDDDDENVASICIADRVA